MEKYIVNGVEVEYDTFDIDSMELLDSEVTRLKNEIDAIKRDGLNSAEYIKILREQGENILDFFDAVLGDGSSTKIFGNKMNIRDLLNEYKKFTDDVAKVRSEIGSEFKTVAPPSNREQRRAKNREERRRAHKQSITSGEA